jgi:hypothetical protein
MSAPGRADFTSANLTPATGARTTRLCRPQLSPFVRAPFDRSRGSLNGCPALRSRHAPDAAASTASHPAFVTIASRPSGDRTARVLDLIWVNGKAKYFRKQGWTGQIRLNRFNKSNRARRGELAQRVSGARPLGDHGFSPPSSACSNQAGTDRNRPEASF